MHPNEGLFWISGTFTPIPKAFVAITTRSLLSFFLKFSDTMFFFMASNDETLHINNSGLKVVLYMNLGLQFFFEIVNKFGNMT